MPVEDEKGVDGHGRREWSPSGDGGVDEVKFGRRSCPTSASPMQTRVGMARWVGQIIVA